MNFVMKFYIPERSLEQGSIRSALHHEKARAIATDEEGGVKCGKLRILLSFTE